MVEEPNADARRGPAPPARLAACVSPPTRPPPGSGPWGLWTLRPGEPGRLPFRSRGRSVSHDLGDSCRPWMAIRAFQAPQRAAAGVGGTPAAAMRSGDGYDLVLD